MWMGGVPPLGYRVQDRKLVIIDSEAELVRSIFVALPKIGDLGDPVLTRLAASYENGQMSGR
jgi:hypothetical protein